jgi:hypothetical protein
MENGARDFDDNWRVEYKNLKLPSDPSKYRTGPDNVHEQIYCLQFAIELKLDDIMEIISIQSYPVTICVHVNQDRLFETDQ